MSRLVTNAIRSTAASSDAMTIDSAGKPSFPNGGVGKILQVVQTIKKDVFSQSLTPGTTSTDITGLTVTITPSNASNKLLLDARVNAGPNNSTGMYGFFYKDVSLMTDALGDAGIDGNGSALRRISFGSQGGTLFDWENMHGNYLDTAGGTSAITYSIRLQTPYVGSASGAANPIYVNRCGDPDEARSDWLLARFYSTFTVMEVAA